MIKINKLEIENVKRIKAVKIEPTKNGLTIIGGKNSQGKTSVIDSIAWALGGNKFAPSNPKRDDSIIPPRLKVILSNGLVVERKGKNSDLKVTDPTGQKGGQQLLDKFVEELAIDLPKFLNSSSKEKAKTLLKIIGVEEELISLELKEKELYNKRLAIGQIADQKEKYAKEQTYYPDTPKDFISASVLIQQQQEILARNGENQKKRNSLVDLTNKHNSLEQLIVQKETELSKLKEEFKIVKGDLETASKSTAQLIDESTEELEKNLLEIEEINNKVRINLDKEKAEEDALQYKEEYNELTVKIEKVRDSVLALLNNCTMPLSNLSVKDGELTFHGKMWDSMSSSEQLKVATAIVRKLNPDCGFVLLDKLEQMDLETMREFGEWLESENLQAIATRVSTGEECSIIIEDGYVKGEENVVLEQTTEVESAPVWKEGEF